MSTSPQYALHLEQVKLLYRNLKVVIPGNLFVLAGIIWVSWSDVGKLQGLLWVVAMLVMLLRVSVHAICSGLQALDCSNTKRTETGLCAKP
jgi:uncharacterized protein YqgC (DUF456 family)